MEDPSPSTAEASVRGRTVVVSGAAGKIGRAVCLALAETGANVVVNDVKAEAVEEIVSLLSSKNCTALGLSISATLGKDIVDQTIARFGKIDAVVNAILGPISWKPFEDVTDDQLQIAFVANVMGPLSILRAAWPHFKEQKYGRAVNFTSDSMLGFPTASDYTMTKGALFGLNKTLAFEGANHNIKVNCVSPIAFHPNMERHIQRFSEPVQDAFRTLYTPEANVPMILALITDQCSASGEVFSTSGWAAGRNIWGVPRGVGNLRSVDDCLREMSNLCEKNTRAVFEPTSMVDFTEFQAGYVLADTKPQ